MKRLLLSLLCVPFLLPAEPLAAVLARMDQSAQQFQSLSAKMKRQQFTAVLNESSTMQGSVRLRRVKNATEGVIEFGEPEPRSVFVKGKEVQIFYPKANTVEIYDASKYTSNIDQLLLLGFGTTSAALKKSYDIREGGTEKINGMDATRIDLLPKSAELQKLISKIEMWIPEGQSNPVRQKISEPSKNYELVDYTDLKLNASIADALFRLTLPSGVKKVYPQK